MLNSSVLWRMFLKTGQIGVYLLYKSVEEGRGGGDLLEEPQLSEVASERG